MKVNKRLMKRVRGALSAGESDSTDENRKCVRKLVELARDDVDRSSLYRMLDVYREDKDYVRSVLNSVKQGGGSMVVGEGEVKRIIEEPIKRKAFQGIGKDILPTSYIASGCALAAIPLYVAIAQGFRYVPVLNELNPNNVQHAAAGISALIPTGLFMYLYRKAKRNLRRDALKYCEVLRNSKKNSEARI